MSEHIDEQVSEFVDDEMSIEECDFFVRRLQRDDDTRARFMRYQLIRAVIRGDRIQTIIDVPVSREAASPSRFFRAGIAASLIIAAVFGFVAGDSTLNASGITDYSSLTRVQSDVTGVQYLIHHMGSSSGLNRTLMHASVFSGADSDDRDDAEDESTE